MAARPHRPAPAITIVGLGPGEAHHLTLAARAALDDAERVVARVPGHPALQVVGAEIIDCDDLYEVAENFDAVYRAIAERVLTLARKGSVVYAVPGDPAVGETAVGLIRSSAAEAGMDVLCVPGISFIEPALAALGWDALDGLQIADATVLAQRHHPNIDPGLPALVAQLHSRLLASDVKLVLLNQYPDDHRVTLLTGAGDDEPVFTTRTLSELDHFDDFDDRTSLAIPAVDGPSSLLELADVIAHLRAPEGCPWDREQTHETLAPYMLEEAHEAVVAIEAGEPTALAQELGDVLLQVVLHAQIAVEAGDFALGDVVRSITEKLVRRHPHVFDVIQVESADEVVRNWEQLKAAEEGERGGGESSNDLCADIPPTLPGLMRAQKLQRRARRNAELATDLAAPSEWPEMPANQPDELTDRSAIIGDALWELTKLASAWSVDAESALRRASRRFEQSARDAVSAAIANSGPTANANTHGEESDE